MGSLQVEFRCLSARTGDERYARAADEAFEALQSVGLRGILPVFLSAPSVPKVQAVASKFAFGALADSYYESAPGGSFDKNVEVPAETVAPEA